MARRKRSPKRPRTHALGFTFPKDTPIRQMMIHSRTGEVRFLGEDGQPVEFNAFAVRTTYDRPKGEKVTIQAPVPLDYKRLDPNSHLLAYSVLFAVDTNTRIIRGHSVSLVGAFEYAIGRASDTLIELQPVSWRGIELHDVRAIPERYGWRCAIDTIRKEITQPDARIGVIVDHDLNALDAINKREAPVFEEWFLPDGVSLIYASSDASDTIANYCLRQCDSIARKALEAIEQNDLHAHLVPVNCKYFSQMRHWACLLDESGQPTIGTIG